MRKSTTALFLTIAAPAYASAPRPDDVKLFVRQALQASSYKRADADINGDGRKESFVYLTDPRFCGSGGCLLLVLSPNGSSYKVVMRATVTKPPIMVLRTAAHGWRDVGATVRGGGIVLPYMARLRFDGHSYPSNPTVSPALPLRQSVGKVLIGG